MTNKRDEEKEGLPLFYGNEGESYKEWKRSARAFLAGLPTTVAAESFGPKVFGLLRGNARVAVKHVTIESLQIQTGENLLFDALDIRFPEEQDQDRLEESLEEVFGDPRAGNAGLPIKDKERAGNPPFFMLQAYFTLHEVSESDIKESPKR